MKNYAYYPADSYATFRQFLEGTSRRFGEKEALVSYSPKGERRCLTFSQLKQNVQALSEAFRLSLPEGNIAILSENSIEWLLVYFALIVSGRTAVCIDIEQSDDVLRSMILQADCTACFLSPAFEPVGSLLCQENPRLKQLLLMEKEGKGALAELLAQGQAITARHQGGWSFPDHAETFTASIVYTSGTTSTSKPVMLSEVGILTNAADSMRLVAVGATVFTSLPFYHTYGLTCSVINMLLHGSTVGVNGSLKTMMRDLKTFAPETMMAVPLIVETLHQNIWRTLRKQGKEEAVLKYIKLFQLGRKFNITLHPAFLQPIREAFGGHLSLIICGGAHLSASIGAEMEAFGFQIIQGYGITECSPLLAVNRNKDRRVDTVGHVLPSYKLKLKDGEILVQGVSLMQGYYKNEELTAAAFDDGWFMTGDLGSLDKNGHLTITGRKKNLIVFKNGKKVSPEEIESYVSSLPLIKEVMAFGLSSSSHADDVRLALMVYPDPELTAGMSSYEILEQLQTQIDQINETLPVYKQIQMIKLRDSEFEKTATKKIKRSTILEKR